MSSTPGRVAACVQLMEIYAHETVNQRNIKYLIKETTYTYMYTTDYSDKTMTE